MSCFYSVSMRKDLRSPALGWTIWMRRAQSLGCNRTLGRLREVNAQIRDAWTSAKHCLHASRKLGQAAPAILTILQLRGSQTKWQHVTELKHRQCDLTKDETSALEQYLSLAVSRRDSEPILESCLAISSGLPACQCLINSK